MVDTAGLKFVALGAAQFLAEIKRAQQAEQDLARVAKQAEGEVGDASTKAAREVDVASAKQEAAHKRVGLALKAVSGIATGLFVAGAVSAVKAAMNFEDSLDQVGAVAQATEKDMVALRQEALKIGADTSFSAGQAASAMHELAAGGRSVAQIMGGEARAAVGLAEAGNYGLAESAKTIATAMDIWKNTQIDTNDVVNRLAGAANTSRFGVEDMSMAIAQGGGVAAQAGVSFQDFSTVIAATASSFASGSDAGTSFKTFITSLSGSSDIAKQKIAELGLEFYDAQGAIRPMADIVQQLHDKLGPLSQEQQTVALKTIFGNDAFRTAASLMQLTGEEFSEMSAKMRDTDAVDVAAQRMGNASGGMEQLRGSIESLSIAFGQQFIPFVTKALALATQLVNFLGKLPVEAQSIAFFGAMLATALPLIVSFTRAVKEAAVAIGLLRLAANPAGIAIAAVVAGVVAADQILRRLPGGGGLAERLFGGDKGLSDSERWVANITRINKELTGFSAEKGLVEAANNVRMLADAIEILDKKAAGTEITLGGEPTGVMSFPSKDELEDIAEARASYARQAAAWLVAEYELAGGAQASAESLKDLAYQYAALPPEARKLVEEQSGLVEHFKNTNQVVTRQAELTHDLIGAYREYEQELASTPEGPSMPFSETPAVDAWISSFDEIKEGADGTIERIERLDLALANLNARFAEGSPEMMALNAENAIYRDALAEMDVAQTDYSEKLGLTREQIEGLIEANDRQISSMQSNKAVMETMGTLITNLIGDNGRGWIGINKALADSTLSTDAQAAAAAGLLGSIELLNAGSISESMNQFALLKDELADQPEVWQAVAAAMGPEFVEKISSSISDPTQRAELIAAVQTLFGGAADADATAPAQSAADHLVSVITDNISGTQARANIQAATEEGLAAVANARSEEEADTAGRTLVADVSAMIADGESQDAVVAALETAIQAVKDARAQPEAEAAGTQAVEDTSTAIEAGGPTITSAMDMALSEGLGGATIDIAKANALGSAMVDGVVAGITSQAGNIGGTLTNEMAGAIADAKANALRASSPSKVTRDELGIPIVEGIAEGITTASPKMIMSLVKAINAMSDEARLAMSGLLDAMEEGYDFTGPAAAMADGVLSPLFQALANLGLEINEDASIGRSMYLAGIGMGEELGQGVIEAAARIWQRALPQMGHIGGGNPLNKTAEDLYGGMTGLGDEEYRILRNAGLTTVPLSQVLGLDYGSFDARLSGLTGHGTGDPFVRGIPSQFGGAGTAGLITEETRLANAELAAMEDRLARIGTLLHNAGGESARVRDATGEWFTWDDYREMETKIEAFKEQIKTIPEDVVTAQIAWQEAQADMLRSLSVDLLANLESGKELTLEEFNSLFLQLDEIVANADLPENVRQMAEEAVAGWRQALVDGVGVANEDIVHILLELGAAMEISAREIGNDFADGVMDGIQHGTRVSAAKAVADLEAFIDQVESMAEQTRIEMTSWMSELAENLANGREMTEDEMAGMFERLSHLILNSGLPDEMRDLAQKQLIAWIEQFKSGAGVANAELITWLEGLIAAVGSAAAEAAAAAAAEVEKVTSTVGGGASGVPGPDAGKAGGGRTGVVGAAEAAAIYGVTEEEAAEWLMKQRIANGQDPYTGEPLPVKPAGNPTSDLEILEGGSSEQRHAAAAIRAKNAAYEQALAQAGGDYSRVIERADGTYEVLPPVGRMSGGSGGNAGMVSGFAHGTDFVPQDGLAYLHRGEAVIPAWMNDIMGTWSGMFRNLFAGHGSFGDLFGSPLIPRRAEQWKEASGGISFQPGSLVVNYSGPAEQARQVGEDFGEALVRTLRVSGARI